MTNEHVITYDIGCRPSPSGSGEVVIQTEESTFVIFLAMSTALSDTGHCEDLGIAVVECQGCSLTKFGYPNDEGLNEHPLFLKGLDECNGIGEVINSSWKAMLEEQMDTSAHRIWGEHYGKAYNVPEGGQRGWEWKHFIFTFKENTFECIADDLKVTLSKKHYREVLSEIVKQILDE